MTTGKKAKKKATKRKATKRKKAKRKATKKQGHEEEGEAQSHEAQDDQAQGHQEEGQAQSHEEEGQAQGDQEARRRKRKATKKKAKRKATKRKTTKRKATKKEGQAQGDQAQDGQAQGDHEEEGRQEVETFPKSRLTDHQGDVLAASPFFFLGLFSGLGGRSSGRRCGGFLGLHLLRFDGWNGEPRAPAMPQEARRRLVDLSPSRPGPARGGCRSESVLELGEISSMTSLPRDHLAEARVPAR